MGMSNPTKSLTPAAASSSSAPPSRRTPSLASSFEQLRVASLALNAWRIKAEMRRVYPRSAKRKAPVSR